jgi:hypothetical protein
LTNRGSTSRTTRARAYRAPRSGEAATTLIAANVNRDSLAIATGHLYFQIGPDLVTVPTGGGAITTLVPGVDKISQIVEQRDATTALKHIKY